MKKILLVLLWSSINYLYAGGVTYTVVVDRNKVPNDEVLGQKLADFGVKRGIQPFQITRYEINQNPKYSLWQVTLTDQAQIDKFNALRTGNKITVICETTMSTRWDNKIGGWIDDINSVTKNPYPNDFFIVGVSTP